MKPSLSRGPSSTRGILVLFVAIAATACGGGSASGGGPSPTPEPAGDTDRDLAALEALYQARADSALMEFTEADVRFMTGMIRHHAQALDMAEMAPTHGANPTIRTLAARIINAQRDEIATMVQWLRDRGQPVPDIEAVRNVMREFPVAGGGPDELDAVPVIQRDSLESMEVPGMLTPDEMSSLEQARGGAFDCLFLTSMIQHHRGAVTAVRELFATDGAARGDVTFKLASGIQVDQITEIDRMDSMLESMDGC